MSEHLWPMEVIPGSQSWRVVGNVGVFESPLSGAVRTVSRPGARLGCTMTVPPLKGVPRARMIQLVTSLRDRSNVVRIPDYSTTRRGSISVPELLTNNDFINGTAGWTGSRATLSVSDRVMRAKYDGSSGSQPAFLQAAAATPYAPYALRSFIADGSQTAGLSLGPSMTYGSASAQAYSAARGLVAASAVVDIATAQNQFPVAFSTGSGYTAGAYVDCHWTSYARCGLVDNGPNALLQSDVFGTTWAPTRATVTTNSVAAPDGTTTADTLNEDGTAATTHYIGQSITVGSAAADFTLSVSIKAGTRSWVAIEITESAGSHAVRVYLNLATGALGTLSSSGANWTNQRAFAVAEGNGWFRLHLVARKTSAATTLTPLFIIAEADADIVFSGASAASLYLWRGSLAQSSVPVLGRQTTTTATAGTSQTGNGLYLKGLPASTSGLIKAGDPVQVGSQMNFAVADLDSDAAGCGYLLCGLPWRVSPADNDPVIFNTPMAKMRLVSDTLDWDTGPGQFSPFQLEFIEDVT